MTLTRKELYRHVRNVCLMKDTAYYGGYRKAFRHFLRQAREQRLVWSWAQ